MNPESPSPRLASWHRRQGAIAEGVLSRHTLVGGDGAGRPALLAVMLGVPEECAVPAEPS